MCVGTLIPNDNKILVQHILHSQQGTSIRCHPRVSLRDKVEAEVELAHVVAIVAFTTTHFTYKIATRGHTCAKRGAHAAGGIQARRAKKGGTYAECLSVCLTPSRNTKYRGQRRHCQGKNSMDDEGISPSNDFHSPISPQSNTHLVAPNTKDVQKNMNKCYTQTYPHRCLIQLARGGWKFGDLLGLE